SSMVVPTPTAAPPTDATRGFSHRASACKNRTIGAPSAPPLAIATKSLRSLPAQKTSGEPASSRHRTLAAVPASSIAAAIVSYMASVSAFFFSGRLIRILRTGPSLLMTMSGIVVPNVEQMSQKSGGSRRAETPNRTDDVNVEDSHGAELL